MAAPTALSNAIAKLSPDQALLFKQQYNKRKRSLLIAYLLWVLLGFHYIYLKKYGTAFLFWATLGGVMIWWLIDALRLPSQVGGMNEQLGLELIGKVRAAISE